MDKKFLIRVCFFSFFFILSIFFLNILVDPLWYFKGNKITKVNYTFNERLTKFNLFYFIKKDIKYDCIIFGSSISTTINDRKFKKNKCFNFSFSAGGIHEYIIYLEYLEFINLLPKKIYLELPIFVNSKHLEYFETLNTKFPGIEKISFIPPISTKNLITTSSEFLEDRKKQSNSKIINNYNLDLIPKFIKNKTAPDQYWKYYLSLKSFSFSIRSLFKSSNYTNAYDKNFLSFVRKDKIGKFGNDFEKLNLSKNTITEVVNNRLKVIEYFEKVYDFSLPNSFVNDPSNTYDGSHYFRSFISNLPDFMENSNLKFGTVIDSQNYSIIFKKSLNAYLNEIN